LRRSRGCQGRRQQEGAEQRSTNAPGRRAHRIGPTASAGMA
jgi:hypothetical protein